jgi:hypothetical protein
MAHQATSRNMQRRCGCALQAGSRWFKSTCAHQAKNLNLRFETQAWLHVYHRMYHRHRTGQKVMDAIVGQQAV